MYIGSTTENLNVRLSKMIGQALHSERRTDKIGEWIRELFDISLRPMINLLEVSEPIHESAANDRQGEFISEHQERGECEMNMTLGRATHNLSIPKSEETKKKIAEGVTKDIDLEKIADLRTAGKSWRKVAEEMELAYVTVYKRKDEIKKILDARSSGSI
jgi:hypothetical protein